MLKSEGTVRMHDSSPAIAAKVSLLHYIGTFLTTMLIFQLCTSYNHINNIMVVSILTDLHAMLEAPVVIKLQGFVFEGVSGLFSAKW